MNNKILKKFKIPDSPGVYFFLKGKDIIYIGKATSLKGRVKSYFGKDLIATRGPMIVDMVWKSDNLKWQKTDSVLEALILEANLIKKFQPYNNVKEKDDKSWNHVCITAANIPLLIVERARNINFNEKTAREMKFKACYGPFTSGRDLTEALKLIRRIFPFLDDKSKNNYEFYKQVNLAPDISTAENIKLYKNNIKNIKLFFEGKKKRILKNLQKEMKKYAKRREFERAGEIKRQIFALKHINDIALLKNSLEPRVSNFGPNFKIEAYDIAHMSGRNMVGVMTVVENNSVVKSEYKRFRIRTQNNANDTGALREVLERRLAHSEWVYPDLIVVDGGMAQINMASRVLKKVGLNIPVVSVVKDERHRPKNILGNKEFSAKYESEILLANSEAHRFAIAYHKNMRNRNFLK